ncbi:ferredoxin [Sphingomonas sp. VDB2]|uniref:ferredoxin n=1 Tax=Sphingomonas sp. VDB2 TaxID=3228751 RepID=UPI003A800490
MTLGWLGELLSRLTHKVSVKPIYTPLPPHPANVPGIFYVEDGCCISCGVWEDVAPDLLAWPPDGSYSHCYVARQPQTDEELSRMMDAMHVSEVDCIRARNCGSDWAERLRQAGLGDQIDPD